MLSYQPGFDRSESCLQPLIYHNGEKKQVQVTAKYVYIILIPVGASVLGCRT